MKFFEINLPELKRYYASGRSPSHHRGRGWGGAKMRICLSGYPALREVREEYIPL